MQIEMNRDQRREAADLIKRHFLEEREEEIGDLAAGLMLDFFLKRLGGYIYNQALSDARTWFMQKLEGLEIDYSLLVKETL